MPSSHVLSVPTIQIAECGSGLRKNCMRSTKCTLRHIGEYPGEMITKYVKEKPFQCNECKRQFKSSSGLKTHISRLHQKEPSIPSAQSSSYNSNIPPIEDTDNCTDQTKVKWGSANNIYEVRSRVLEAHKRICQWKKNTFSLPIKERISSNDD